MAGKPAEILLPEPACQVLLCFTDLNSSFLQDCSFLMEQIVRISVVKLKFVVCICVSLELILWWGGGRAVIFAMCFLHRMTNTLKCKLMCTCNSSENRHDHRHHFHQRGNRNREFVTCSRSHTEHWAELLGVELNPPLSCASATR